MRVRHGSRLVGLKPIGSSVSGSGKAVLFTVEPTERLWYLVPFSSVVTGRRAACSLTVVLRSLAFNYTQRPLNDLSITKHKYNNPDSVASHPVFIRERLHPMEKANDSNTCWGKYTSSTSTLPSSQIQIQVTCLRHQRVHGTGFFNSPSTSKRNKIHAHFDTE